MDNTVEIFKGDNTAAFGGTLVKINLTNPNGYAITKCIFAAGRVQKIYENPVFPLFVNLSGEETKQLSFTNVCHLSLFDSEGRKRTLEKTFTFNAKDGVTND